MTGTYRYNQGCPCGWCQNGGNPPANTADNGHSFGYEQPHMPPTTSPWKDGRLTGTTTR